MDTPTSTNLGGDSPASVRILAGGVVAYNEERNIESAVRSLLEQDLPDGVRWSSVVVVASGCTDRTLEVAERLARKDSRVDVVSEPERRGKSHALRTVFSRVQGDAVVLLNSDARAERGAIRNLIQAAEGRAAPYAVMGRPVVLSEASAPWTRAVSTMWDLHHHFHEALQRRGGGAHLSDELLLVSLDPVPPMPEGVINDGSYLGVWLAQHLGGRLYAPDARVAIEVPQTVRDHLLQRRRIHVGNAQVASLLGLAPSTFSRLLVREPKEALRLVRRTTRSRPHGAAGFVALSIAELASQALAIWDRVPPARDHVRWRRIQPSPEGSSFDARSSSGVTLRVEARLRSILVVARQFRTGVPVQDLPALLPEGSPSTPEGLIDWLEGRPDLARIKDGRAFAPDGLATSLLDREARGGKYLAAARDLLDRDLGPLRPWLRTFGLTGSAAYGDPDPGDDVDLFVVTRAGTLWWFLALCYLRVRFGYLRRRSPEQPIPCFNYVVDDRRAPAEFANGRGFLFAREALTARILLGDPYYLSLLAQAPWMAEEIPRLYSARRAEVPVEPPPRVPWPIRLGNALLFPVLASYLQMAGLLRNARARTRHSGDVAFRTETTFHRVAFSSRRFDDLRASYASSFPQKDSPGMSAPSRIPTSR